jgi:hypothetical protein
MEVQLAVLADAATVAAARKLNILGIFDSIWFREFPAAYPMMALVMRLRLEYEDGGREHELVITLQDADGREYARAGSRVNVPRLEAGAIQHVDQVLNFAGMVFTKPGRFAFPLLWDGIHKTRVQLNIELGTPPAQ